MEESRDLETKIKYINQMQELILKNEKSTNRMYKFLFGICLVICGLLVVLLLCIFFVI